MWNFRHEKLTEHVTWIVDPTGVSAFLATGEKEAVLMDTCVGFVGLREKVESLTKLPLTVVLTHGHGDHAGGAGEFERVYMHPADKALVKVHGLSMRMDYAAQALGKGVVLTKEDFVPEPAGNFAELSGGQIFDLGGITLEIIHVPGHTKGSCCVLIREEGMILYGDACNANTLVMDQNSTNISTYQKSLEYLKTFDGRYQTVLYSHGPAVGPKDSLEDNIELCSQILRGEDDAVPCEFMGRAAIRAAAIEEGGFARVDGGYGNIVYSEVTRK
ncbi:MAG: MBL fold metallo-hydrolase [Clostridium sp.]|nr:MBL fold metallo-hydrolase [Clostridium sp.]